jgi:predicted short-subunit dehydrogenase-like oxidoreductase (DUF2520 family)
VSRDPLQVAVLGPGRVGTALAMGLNASGHEVVAVAGRGRAALERFRERLPGASVLPAAQAAAKGALVLVAVPDDQLEETVRAVARADGVAEASRWVHVSGARGTAVLRPARLAGAAVAACHPAQTFPDPDAGLAALPGCAWAVTADETDLGWARRLVAELGGRAVTVSEGARTLYHAALTVGANATSAVVTLARDLLLAIGVDAPEVFLEPLVAAAGRNAAAAGAASLTGPVRRGDAATVAAHLDELRTVMPEALEAYVALARLALRYARRAGLDPTLAAAVAEALPGPPGWGAAGAEGPEVLVPREGVGR